MKPYNLKLIELYSRNETEVIGNDLQYQDLCEKNKENPQFHEDRIAIESIKKFIEDTVLIQSRSKNQVIEALYNANMYFKKNDDFISACYKELIKNIFVNRWADEEMQHFNSFFEKLRDYNDYFLSFTNRSSDPTNRNDINVDYDLLIKNVFNQDKLNTLDDKRNLLAYVIHHLLSTEHRGFFFPEREGSHDIIKDKLVEGCEKSFVFIQLIQNNLFEGDVEANFCHFEFLKANENPFTKNFIKYIFAIDSFDDLVKSRNINIDYSEWYNDVRKRDRIFLEHPGIPYKAEQISLLRKRIKVELSKEIEKLKWELIENVPL